MTQSAKSKVSTVTIRALKAHSQGVYCMILRSFPFIFALSAIFLVTGCASTPSGSANSNAGGASELESAASSQLQQSDDPDGYVLGQGDFIGIQVFDEPDLTLDARVSSSGVINYSYLGDITVAGKTPLELERDISELLQNGFLVNPSVNVSVKEFRPFFIGGEVRSPGSYPFQPGLTLDKAIALAGGLTDRASTRRMFVVKGGGDASNPDKISLGEPIAPGDTISIREGFF